MGSARAWLRWLTRVPVAASEARRAELVVLCAVTLTPFTLFFSVRFFRLGIFELGVSCLACALALLTGAIALRCTGALRACTHGVLAVIVAHLTLATWMTGGIASVGTPWFFVFALLAFTLCGARGGWSWALVTAWVMLAFFAADRLGVQAPERIPAASLSLERVLTFTLGIAASGTIASILLRQEARARAALSAEVAERREAEELAKRADQAKTEFLESMSHEIRTPMNGVLGLAELLSRTPLSDRQTRLLETLRACGQDMLDLLNATLDRSKIEACELEIHANGFDLRALLGQIRDLLEPTARSKGLELSLRFAPGAPAWVRGDRVRIRQIVLNLIANALKFTESGGVEVHVECVASGPPPEGVRVSVIDTGVGIDARDQERIFERFAQVDASSARRSLGTGLGLAICRDLARAMGGTLGVRSAPGGGSCFVLELPVPHEVALPQLRDVQLEARYRGRVLVVDDNLVNLEVARGLLEHMGCDVTTATSGSSALQLAREHAFDLIFLDWEMPEMNGAETCAELRARDASAHKPVPVIALTAHAFEEHRLACMQAGMDGMLSKPIELELLRGTLAQYLAVRDPGAALEDATTSALERADARAQPVAGSAAALASVLDPERLTALWELDPDANSGLFARMVATFRDQALQQTEAVLEALRDADGSRAAAVAHALKGAAASLGARRLRECASQIEQLARAGDLEAAAEQARVLEVAVHDALGALADALARRAR